jgi:uncharacterized NAD-dependent epimerase/dehydratase family protein
MLKTGDKIALYMKGAINDGTGKMGWGVIRYSPHEVVCVIDPDYAGSDTAKAAGMPKAVPIVGTIEEALALGPTVVVLGTAPLGGKLPEAWLEDIEVAINRGVSLLNGLHQRLSLRFTDLQTGQWVWDIRQEPTGLGSGKGAARHLTNKRVLFVGTDMAIGKMTAGLELYRYAQERGTRAAFVATGQIGITITGAGIPLDAIRVDFASAAVEREVLRYADQELVIIEGQGALCHPGSTSNLPLLRGSCPTHLVLCHKARHTHLKYLEDVAIPPLKPYIDLYEQVGSALGTFARPVTVGVALNTFGIASDTEALDECKRVEDEVGLPCVDPVRHGVERLYQALASNGS